MTNKYELLDRDQDSCGSASLAQILEIRSERERHHATEAFDDESTAGPYYYVVGCLKLEISEAVPAAVTIAQVAASAKRAYENMASGIEFMPEPVSGTQCWGVAISQAHELLLVSLQAAKAAGYSDFREERVYFPERLAVENALELLASEFEEDDPVRIAVGRFVGMLRQQVGTWTTDPMLVGRRRMDSSLPVILAMRPPQAETSAAYSEVK